ncbi:MAG: HPr family phosphocarrier protein [Pseudomonadota bacterium]
MSSHSLHERLLVENKLGIHARAAAKLVALANHYVCSIELTKKDITVNAKSIMSVLMLAANQGTELELRIEGDDAEEARVAITELFKNRFGESE